jgi:tape measure domain-containing protein
MQRDIKRELNKIDDGTAKTVGRKIGKDLELSVGQGAQGAANQVKARLSAQLGSQVGMVVGRGVGGAISTSMTAAAKVGEFALKGALVGAAGVASLAVGGVGLALTKGFDRLKSIDEAKFKLKALGNDAGSIAKIMDSALASVKGTAFGMDDAVTAASSAVAAGIKPGQDLTKYLGEVGDAAAVAGTNFTDMGSIFNKIQTSNKAYTDDLQQLSDRGLPIFTWLQKEYGVTADQLTKMVQSGEVDAAHFQHAIETNIGGAAKTMGQSFSGSVDNAQAALGRLGAAFLTPIFGNAAGGISGITDGLDNLTTWVNAHQPEIIKFFSNMGVAAVSVAQDILKSFASIVGAVGTLSHAFGSVLDGLGIDNNLTSIGDTLTGLQTTLTNTAASWDTGKQKIRDWGAAASEAAANMQGASGAVTGVGTALGALPFKKVIGVDADTKGASDKIAGIGNAVGALKDKTITVNVKGQLSVNGQVSATNTAKSSFDGVFLQDWIDPNTTQSPTPSPRDFRPKGGGRAAGGGISGAGGPTSDQVPIWASNGEHMWTAGEVNDVGGQSAMYRIRAMARAGLFKGFAQGGAITIDALKTFASGISGHGYVWGGGNGDTFATDCSGAQATISNFITGGQGRFATGTEGTALLSRGFQAGDPPPGVTAYWVGWKNGGPGGGHTAGTIVDPNGGNVNVEMGGRSGGGSYGSGAGASDFPNRAWIAVAGGDDPSKNNFGGPSGSSSGGGGSLPSSSGGGGADASSLAGTVLGGLQQSTGLDGSVFSDPTQWPNVKSGIALLNFFTGLAGGQDSVNIGGVNIPGIGGLLKPSGMDALNPIQNLPNAPHQGTGAAPGPSIVNNGTIGMDPRALTQRADAHQNQAWRKSGMNAVRPQ